MRRTRSVDLTNDQEFLRRYEGRNFVGNVTGKMDRVRDPTVHRYWELEEVWNKFIMQKFFGVHFKTGRKETGWDR